MRIAVLDIGGTSIKSGIWADGVLLEKKETPSNALLGGAHIMEAAAQILAGYEGYTRIGISTAGQVDTEQGVIRYANSNIPGYTGVRVREILEGRFGLPVAVENDVNAAAVGEAVYGAGRDAKNGDFLCLTFGTGIGGAVVMGGALYKGASFSAGEFGHIITHAEAGRDGYYEKYASTGALVRMASGLDPTLDSGRAIFARLQEPEIRALVDGWLREVLYGLAGLVHIFNPALVVLGGGVMAQPYMIEGLRRGIGAYIMPSYRAVQLAPAQLGNNAGMYGAGHLTATRP